MTIINTTNCFILLFIEFFLSSSKAFAKKLPLELLYGIPLDNDSQNICNPGKFLRRCQRILAIPKKLLGNIGNFENCKYFSEDCK
jgi:hypothetical protein